MESLSFHSPIGPLTIYENEGFIVRVDFSENKTTSKSPLILECKKQLDEYFQKKRKEFDLPLKPQGTKFQTDVWNTLCSIPYGECVSYKDVATMINNPKAVRAVGGANNKNPIAIIIPCHRVIGSDGKLVGYGGGIDIKINLLELEGYDCSSRSI
ncbi:MAG: methylated-DNA--[protein]-cysteine S-methyltransferase [Sulfurospirillaceae bacterium]|jgi:methylated-DNA-[protein]-cysteine S-methyltransferase|nr:methylated-DNA--[protein]-cysteine S-methyltransferase [Sulfurospirillaceae bacterium]MDY0237717.1 methylated-DNA--[protein]-cysteine S-methyltransferase [Campylobacterales bacterium]NLM98694.1 methylated-DNA--[protein]-cysteine S-methyltransferase [Campylobacteraceae bacterium]